MKADEPRDSLQQQKGFGTFGGVFTPCTLTILGVIMFLRFGQVVGEAGIWQALVIVAMAKLITTLTSLSLSAIATNTRVEGGGAYFLISRSLGVEFGGAIGIVFFLSQAVSVALYVIGFTEALLAVMPALAEHGLLVASLVNVLVCGCVLIGAGWTIKVQYVILAILLLSIASFVTGALDGWDSDTLQQNWSPGYSDGFSIWTMFALFFPAATGIMAGANMSGDLANPARSIPRGTLASIAVTGLVYVGFALLLGASAERHVLQTDFTVVSETAWSASLIVAGIFAATLSSALGSMMGAPRILQALAKDRVFPFLTAFAKSSGGEPRRAILLSAVIAQCGILLGDLNAIAPIITMFFMITYGALNFATFSEAVSGNPSYRPTFRWCHWSLALLGAILCAVTMVLIDPSWAVIAVLLMVGIYYYLRKQEIRASWGDVASGAAFERTRRNLLLLEQQRYHPKNWRPTILALGAAKEQRRHLALQGRALAGEHGLLIIGQVVIGPQEDYLERHAPAQRVLRRLIDEQQLDAFPAVIIAPSLSEGIASLVQTCGIGALRPNLVLFGWSADVDKQAAFLANLRAVARLGRSLAMLRHSATVDREPAANAPIDVWWLGLGNGALMLLLAHLLRSNQGWRGRSIRLLRMVPPEAPAEDVCAHLDALALQARIPVTSKVVHGKAFAPMLHQESRNSALTILGFGDPNDLPDDILSHLDRLAGDLPRVLFVHSSGDMSLQV